MGHTLLVIGYVSSLISLFLGIIGLIFSENIIHHFLVKDFRLVPGAKLYNEWLNQTFPVYMNFYLFDLKNPNEFLKGANPKLEEVGPFVFREYIFREDIVDNMNGTISYKERRRYEFMHELSPHEIDYEITALNMAVVTVLSKIRYSSSFIHDAVNLALKLTGDDNYLVKKPVREILFGYEDPFLKELRKLVPSLVPSDVVGLFTDRNNTIYANWTIYTGAEDYTKVGIIERFNGMESLNYWSTPYANMINGTDGSVLSPFIDNEQVIYSYQKDLCRSIYGKPKSWDKFENIDVLKFSPDEYFFANTSVNPDNGGFCTPAGNCLAAGVLNLTNCLQGIPIIMSSVHFLYCDPKFIAQLDGVSTPTVNDHATLIYVEQSTGVLMKAHKRIQFNSLLIRDSRIECAKSIPEVLYPLFWVDENLDLDTPTAKKIYYEAQLPIKILTNGKYAIFAFGLILMLVCIWFSFVYRKRAQQQQQQQQSEPEPPVISETTPLINNA